MRDSASSFRATKKKGPHPVKRLTAVTVRKLGPGRYADGGGLYLEVDPSGARRWFLRATVHGRRAAVGLGPTSLVSLAEAREKAAALRKVAWEGGDPYIARDKDKRASPSFEAAARKVHAEHIAPHTRSAKHAAQWISTLETYAFPIIGAKPVHAIDQADVLRVLAPIWTEIPATARRVRQRLKTILDWASTAGHRAEGVNPCDGIERGLPRQRVRAVHLAALEWQALPALWPRLEAAEGMSALALRFTILCASRSGETRNATWDEVDLDGAVWTIPAERMKAGREHRVPLSPEALAVLAEAAAMRSGPLVFPAPRSGKPLVDVTLSMVLRRAGVQEATPHGFRSTFRDWCETTAFPHAVKEMALAHAVKSRVEGAYLRTDHLDRRRELMDAWARFATSGGAEVVRLAGQAAR